MEPFDKENDQPTGSGEGVDLSYPTLFIPKTEGYQVPDSGQGMVDFKKVSEDAAGCTIEVTHFEGEGPQDATSPTEEMDTTDHVDAFLNQERQKPMEKPTTTGGY